MNFYLLKKDNNNILLLIKNNVIYIAEYSETVLLEDDIVTFEDMNTIEKPKNGMYFKEDDKTFIILKVITIDPLNLKDDNELDVYNTLYVAKKLDNTLHQDIIPITKHTYTDKVSYGKKLLELTGTANPVLKIHKDFTDVSVDDVIVELHMNEDSLRYCPDITYEVITESLTIRYPRFEIIGDKEVLKNDVITLEAQMFKFPENTPIQKAGVPVYIKSDIGYLPYTRVLTDANGKIKFKFSSQHLESGDVAKIKLGFRFYSNTTNFNIDII